MSGRCAAGDRVRSETVHARPASATGTPRRGRRRDPGCARPARSRFALSGRSSIESEISAIRAICAFGFVDPPFRRQEIAQAASSEKLTFGMPRRPEAIRRPAVQRFGSIRLAVTKHMSVYQRQPQIGRVFADEILEDLLPFRPETRPLRHRVEAVGRIVSCGFARNCWRHPSNGSPGAAATPVADATDHEYDGQPADPDRHRPGGSPHGLKPQVGRTTPVISSMTSTLPWNWRRKVKSRGLESAICA